MKVIAICSAFVMLAASGGGAQNKTITGDVKVVKVTVEAIERASRDVTVKKPDGKYEVLHVPDSVTRFDSLKVGDTVNARYYETIVLHVKAPGEKEADNTLKRAVVPAASDRPAGTASVQQTITATITAIDRDVPSITFTGPHNWTYSSRVEDRAALDRVKVGDKVDITWTAALLVAIEDGK